MDAKDSRTLADVEEAMRTEMIAAHNLNKLEYPENYIWCIEFSFSL